MDKWLYLSLTIVEIVITVNVVIFAGGKFRENVGKTFHGGVIFTIFHLLFYVPAGDIFAKKAISLKTRKSPPRKFPCVRN